MHLSRTDQDLMSALVRGDDEAFAAIIDRWGRPVWCFVDRLCGSMGASEDVYQEVWTRLYRHRRHYQPWRAFRPYLFSIAANCCRSALRKQRWRQRPARLDALDGAVRDALVRDDRPPLDRLIEKEQRERLYRAIDRLPWSQREVVLTYCLVTTDSSEIATALGKTAGTVRSHMHQALKKLRYALTRTAEEVDHEQRVHRPT